MTIPKALSALDAEVRSWRDERSTVRHLSIQNSGVTTSLCINAEVSHPGRCLASLPSSRTRPT